MKRSLSIVAGVLLFAAISLAQEIPTGTILPVQLDSTLKAGKSKPGEQISAKIAQDVSLGNGAIFSRGTQVKGHVVESRAASAGSPARIVVVFDSVRARGSDITVVTSLRALASMNEVFNAQLPSNLINDYGSTIHDWNTVQVGGQGVYRGDGKVMSGPDVVGRASSVGEVFAKPIASPRSPCIRDAATDREQSFWVFSTDACGLYGFASLQLSHAGRTQPQGQIVLEAPGNLIVRGGSGWLLTVIGDRNNSEQKADRQASI
jgi:hypothetical protein